MSDKHTKELGMVKRPETSINTGGRPLTPDVMPANFLSVETQVFFLRYPDGTLRLFKPGQILGEEPAGYSEENVVVKIRVIRAGDDFVVVLPATRHMLDQPGAEDALAKYAINWKR